MATRYELLRRLGTGGMAEVFLARSVNETGFEKLVAFKRSLPQIREFPEARELFLREATLGAMLDHPFIVQVFDGGLKGEQLFLVTEYVDGGDLKEAIEAMRRGGPRLPAEAVALVGSQLCQALAHLYGLRDDKGSRLVVAHRDVSPGNVLCTRAGTVKLSDFGVVRTQESNTGAGVIRGKWDYFPPEVAKGVVDGRGDLFALGVVLYELATLRHPFAAPSPMDRFNRARISEPDPAPELRPELWKVLVKALARNPEARYQTPEELGEALEAVVFSAKRPMNHQALARLLAPLQRPPVSHEKDPALEDVAPLSFSSPSLYAQMAADQAAWEATGPVMDASGKLSDTGSARTLASLGKLPAAPPAGQPPPAPEPGTLPRLAELAELELAAPPPAERAPAPEPPPPPPRSRLPLAMGALALLAVLAGGGVLALHRPGGARAFSHSGDAPLLRVESVPDGAEVYNGGDKLGTTPLTMPNEFKLDDLTILEVRLPGYAPGKVTFLGGRPSSVRAVLKKR